MLANSGLKDATIEKIRSVFSRYPEIEEVILYGSRAMGRHRNGSDINAELLAHIDRVGKVFYHRT